MKMKKIFATSLLLLSAAAFVACSNDDDDTPGPSVKYDVISFEPSTGMVDPSGETIALGNVTMSLYNERRVCRSHLLECLLRQTLCPGA